MDPCHTVRIPRVTSSETPRQPLQERAPTSSNALGSRSSESCRFRLLRNFFACHPIIAHRQQKMLLQRWQYVLLRLEPHSKELSFHPATDLRQAMKFIQPSALSETPTRQVSFPPKQLLVLGFFHRLIESHSMSGALADRQTGCSTETSTNSTAVFTNLPIYRGILGISLLAKLSLMSLPALSQTSRTLAVCAAGRCWATPQAVGHNQFEHSSFMC